MYRKSPPLPLQNILKKQSELWLLHLGSLGETQLQQIHRHTTGLPHIVLHPFHHMSAKADANIQRKPAGPSGSDRPVFTFGQRFSMDFSFMRASSKAFRFGQGATGRVVRSRQGYTAALNIID